MEMHADEEPDRNKAPPGLASDYEDDWYHHRYGWIAFAHDRIYYTYPEWVKLNPGEFSNPIGGWQPTTVNPDIPPGTLALVSGFSALVVEGGGRWFVVVLFSALEPE